MKKIAFCQLIAFTVLFMTTSLLVAQSSSPSETNHQVTLERTEIRTLHSEIIDQDYELFISLPSSYHSGEKHYPLIIGLDAYTGFLHAKGCIDAYTYLAPLMPEVILVGIGYGGTGYMEFARWIAGRTRDFTPVRKPSIEEYYKGFIVQKGFNQLEVHTGGAAQFLSFLNSELLPFLLKEYRIESDNKALFGASFGGLFTLYALFNSSDSFNKYFIESPSINYSDGAIYKDEARYAASHSDLSAEIFICAGGQEKNLIDNINTLDSLLRTRKYQNLHIEKVFFEGENHISCAPAAISRGLIELYNN
ncbi:MAG TPA: alpha/beta hydrolase [Bacteroides sp.]|nr:alpha/beta hydrolase [Bacteroides sp.]